MGRQRLARGVAVVLWLQLTTCSPSEPSRPRQCEDGRRRPGDGELRAAGDSPLHLLQTRAGRVEVPQRRGAGALASLEAPPPPRPLPRPVSWLHVPKCGTSFQNVLLNYPGMCPFLPDNFEISEARYGPQFNYVFQMLHPLDINCPLAFTRDVHGGHEGLGDEDYEASWHGRGVTMLRNPEKRLISAYLHGQHSWPDRERRAANISEYVEVLKGCAVRMMTRGNSHQKLMLDNSQAPCGRSPAATEQEVQLAIERLREGFVFVGITDYWALSICLFHKKFGGPCRAVEFDNTRRGAEHRGTEETENSYDVSKWLPEGFYDEADHKLYSAAMDIFRKDLQRYQVTAETCVPCFEHAQVHIPQHELVVLDDP